ncbi:MAG: hypothetical protein KF851_01395 [Pirellulaceae bacterium]|nr:hypothetical protein [Pirellulaceae bacterium]
MTRTFCCQIQIDRLSFMTKTDVLDIFGKIAGSWDERVEIQTGNDNGEYVNVLIESNDPCTTWERMKWPLVESKLPGSEFSPAMIVTVTGDNGWDDYLLLHHYDRDQDLDELPKTTG